MSHLPPHDDDTYLDPYRQAVKTHGAGFEATLWGSRDAQVLRFDVMIDFVDFTDAVVLDAGCGQGDFAQRLIERNISFRHFVGLDAMPAMIESTERRELQRCTFRAVDFVANVRAFDDSDADYICFSGSLNTMDDATAQALVARAFDAAKRGVVFNFLSDRPHRRWAGKDLRPARRFDTLRWLDWAMRHTSRVNFAQAYLDGHDATIVMLRDEAAA